MSEHVFGFLLDLPEDRAKEWVRRYLKGEATSPAVRVPSDLQPLEFLLGEVNPIPDGALPLRIGTLAGTLLADAIARDTYGAEDPRELKALFTLVESLPVSPGVAEFLNRLAIIGPTLRSPAEAGTDVHLLTLRALILHQRPAQGGIGGLVNFWRRNLPDPRYAAIAMQGLLRISVADAINSLPEFVRRARRAIPPIPLANTLFAVSVELGTDRSLWENLVRAFEGQPDDFKVVKETLGRTRFPESNPVAWEALQTGPRQPAEPIGFAPRYLEPLDSSVKLARQCLPEGLLVHMAA